MAVIRIGSCGIVDFDTAPGTLMLSDESMYCYRNYCHFDGEAALGKKTGECDSRPYLLTAPVKADQHLTDLIEANLKKIGAAVKRGLNCSAETFFACQGRELPLWNDQNADLMKDVTSLGVVSLEMETHQIFHLMHQRQHGVPNGPQSHAASLMIGLVNRNNPSFTSHVSSEDQEKATLAAGEAAFDALVSLVSEGILKPAA